MNENRLIDFLGHIQQAAEDACAYVDGLDRIDFDIDRRTQQAVIMNIIIVGEAATKIIELFPAFAQQHGEVPWRAMRGMRNRIAHGYFDINLDVVWETVQSALPELLRQLPALIQDANVST